MNQPPSVCVVGAGPVGLHTALDLARTGHQVTVLSADPPTRRTATFVGPAAAGLIEPVATEPEDVVLVTGLFRTSYAHWLSLVGDTALGVDLRRVRFHIGAGDDLPGWFGEVGNLAQDGRTAYSFDTAVVTPTLWLAETRRRLTLRGVTFQQRRLGGPGDLTGLLNDFDLVVNASGPGAWTLGDHAMYGRRGVLVWVEPHPRLDQVHFDAATFRYAIPQRHRVALGGTSDPVHGDPARWSRQPDPSAIDQILTGITRLCPDLSPDELTLLGATCDYRPCRSRLRLDLTAAGRLLHLTGLGGSGWTLAPAVAAWAAATLTGQHDHTSRLDAAG